MILPIRITPMPGEPPHGVLARLAMRHREPDVAAFASVHGCPLTGVLQGRSLGVLADLIGIGLDALRVHAPSLDVASRLVSVAGQQLLLNDWSTKTRRWCGRCLREDRMAARLDRQARHPGPWHRASWDIRSVAVCPTHDVALSDRCQACRRAQSFRGPALDRCPCGADLAETEAGTTAGAAEREIEDAGRITSCYIAGRLGLGPRTALPLVDAFPLKDAISTLERLGQCSVHAFGTGAPDRRAHSPSALRDHGAALVLDWPHGFRGALDAVVERSSSATGRPRGLIGAYGWIYSRWLSKLPSSVAAAPLREEFVRHARAHGVVALDEPLFGQEPSAAFDLTKASRKLGVSPPILRRQLQVEGLMPEGARRGVAIPLDASLVEGISERRGGLLRIAEAARRLGIGRPQARSLVDCGLLPCLHLAHAAGRWIRQDDVEDLASRLAGTSSRTASDRTKGASLPTACKAKGVSIATACKAILDGSLHLVAVDRNRTGLHALMLLPASLEPLRPDDWGVSVEIAAGLLGVHHEALRWLVAQGIMTRMQGSSGRIAGIGRQSVESFGHRYVTCVSLAKSMETSSRKLADVLFDHGVIPAFGPPDCRQLLYERASLPPSLPDWRIARRHRV